MYALVEYIHFYTLLKAVTLKIAGLVSVRIVEQSFSLMTSCK